MASDCYPSTGSGDQTSHESQLIISVSDANSVSTKTTFSAEVVPGMVIESPMPFFAETANEIVSNQLCNVNERIAHDKLLLSDHQTHSLHQPIKTRDNSDELESFIEEDADEESAEFESNEYKDNNESYGYRSIQDDEEEEEVISPDNVAETLNPTSQSMHRWNDDVVRNKYFEEEEEIISEQPNSSYRAKQDDDEVEEEQCRVCTGKDDLVSLFHLVNRQMVSDMLMTICPNVSIALKDFLPQFICNTCLDKVIIAIELKNQCENTERELRKKLSRHKNKIRRPKGYIVIDAPFDSDPASEEEPNNDEEFKVSDIASASPDEDSDESDFSDSKRRKIRGTVRRGRRRKGSVVGSSGLKSTEVKRRSKMPLKRHKYNSSEEDGEWRSQNVKQKRMTHQSSVSDMTTNQEFPCNQCGQVFKRKLSLILHQKSHSSARAPIPCEVCGKMFKIRGAYRTHLEKHREDSLGFKCEICNCNFPTNADLKRHLVDRHGQSASFECEHCKRSFASQLRLQRHLENRCPSFQNKVKKTEMDAGSFGKDLFKSVAPLTTTYWSDSFSD